jgi:Photosynthetic reaction centre cytochrome C subunit
MLGVRPIAFGWAATLVAMTGAVAAGRQAQPPSGDAPQMAEKVFKNIQILKGITVDEFMDTMGMFAAATTKDCTGCHAPEILSGSRDAFATPTPMIQRARQMTVMMNTINRSYFGDQKRVTCYTCHSATPFPQRVPNLEIQYGTPPLDNPDRLEFVALPDRANEVDGIFARYLQAIGGAERWAAVNSLAADGTYAGWDTSRVEVPVELFGRAPNQFTTIVHRKEGDNVFVFNGTNGWFAGVDAAAPNFTLQYTGGNLTGARIDALVQIAPHTIQKAYSRWQVSEDLVNDEPVTVLQGTNQGETPVNLYFDDGGLLVRLVRWNDTAVGPVPTQFDFSDYREVGGVRKPYEWVRTWTNNRVVLKLKDVRINVPVDASRFQRPVPIDLPK